MTTNDAGSAPLDAPVRPVLSPRDWQAMALREAAALTGTPEGRARLAESKRYGALADELDRLRSALRVAEGALMECSPCAHPDCQAVQREWLEDAIAGCRRAHGA